MYLLSPGTAQFYGQDIRGLWPFRGISIGRTEGKIGTSWNSIFQADPLSKFPQMLLVFQTLLQLYSLPWTLSSSSMSSCERPKTEHVKLSGFPHKERLHICLYCSHFCSISGFLVEFLPGRADVNAYFTPSREILDLLSYGNISDKFIAHIKGTGKVES